MENASAEARIEEREPGLFQKPPESGIWWISFADSEGHRRREKGGKKAAARDLLRTRKAQVQRNEHIPPRQKRIWTFSRLAAENIKYKTARLAALSIETDESRLKQLLPVMGHIRIDRLTAARIEELLGTMKSGRSGSTINRYRSFVSSCFAFAVKTNRATANPCARVARWKENESRIRWLRPEEETRVRKAFVADQHEWEFDLAVYTGMRRGEQFGLKWADVDVEHNVATVRGKTGRRHVQLNDEAKGALEKLRAMSGEKEFVCPDANAGAKRDTRHWLHDALVEADVKNFRWHDLRHTFASRLVMAGADIRTVQELLGHASIVMTMKYSHLSSEHRQRAVSKKEKR
jgi:site-specific recombinase XerD